MAIAAGGRIVGYNVLVGGGMGVTPSAEKTFPALAQRMAFIRPEEAVDVATAVIMVQRDYGNRSDRKVARLKYLIANRGLAWFKSQVEQYYGHPLAEPHPDDVRGSTTTSAGTRKGTDHPLPRRIALRQDGFDRFEQRLRLQHHAFPAPERPVVHGFVEIRRPVAQVVDFDLHQACRHAPGHHAVIQRSAEKLRENREQVKLHSCSAAVEPAGLISS